MTRKEKLGAAMALISHYVCNRFSDDCNTCAEYLLDTYGIEGSCPFTDLQDICAEACLVIEEVKDSE